MNNLDNKMDKWLDAKHEAKNILITRAKQSKTISYSELAAKINTIHMEAHDPRLFNLLGEISIEEDASNRGMLSAIVVHKSGVHQPGQGFFELAKQLGRNTSDIDKCWIDELNKVFCYWSKLQ